MNAITGAPVVYRTMDEAMQVIRRLDDPTTKLVIYDVETSGLSWSTNYICGHVITLGPAPQDTVYVPVRHGAAGSLDTNIIQGHQYDGSRDTKIHPHPFEVELDRVSRARRDLHWVGHNFVFDMLFAYGHGVEFIGTMEDTQTNAALLNENQPSFSLDYCCKVTGTQAKLGDELYKHLAAKFGGEPDKKQMANFWRLDGRDPIGCDYAVGDGQATWALRERQLERLANEDLMGPWKLESDVLRVIYRMKKRGVLVDRAKLDEVIEYADAKMKNASTALPPDFNVRSAPAIKKLMEANGITNWPRKPPTPLMVAKAAKLGNEAVGNPEFNVAFLKASPIGRAIVDVRQYSNIGNSFAIPLRDRHLHADSRVRPTFHPARNDDFGTVTWRFSCSDPNAQQIPKRNKELAQLFRQVFVPDPGMLWWDADMSQCLAAGTQVMVPGGTKNIEDMAQGDWVYSYDTNRKLVLRKVTWAGQTGVRRLHRLHWMTNGRTYGHLDATDDHLVRMHNGSYRSVGDLSKMKPTRRAKHQCGVSVLALRRAVQDAIGDTRNYLFPNGTTRIKESRFVFEQVNGWLPEEVHHVDRNKLNDDPNNLEGETRDSHRAGHLDELTSRPRRYKVHPDEVIKTMAIAGSMRETGKLLGIGPATVKKRVHENNHIITKIDELPGIHPVYDITVEDTHNFIANEICVHNCEPRLLAHYSGSKVLISGYTATPHVDAHQAVATAAGIDREDGKRLNQTLITGGGRAHIVEMLGGSRGEEIYDAYFRAMPEVKTLQRNARIRMVNRGYVISLMGYRCRLDDPRFAYKAVNRLLQTGNANLMKHQMVQIDRYLEEDGDRVHMLLTIHDALSFQAPNDPECEQVVRTAIQMMADYGPGSPTNLRVPMGVEFGRGVNWAEATFTKDKHYIQ